MHPAVQRIGIALLGFLLITGSASAASNATTGNATCTAFQDDTPMGHDVFGADVPYLACPRAFDCLVNYCLCVGGAIAPQGNLCVNFTASEQTVGWCTAQRGYCLLFAGLDAVMSSSDERCGAWGEQIRVGYAKWTLREASNLRPACEAASCAVIAAGRRPTAWTDDDSLMPNPAVGNVTVHDIIGMCDFLGPFKDLTMPNASSECGIVFTPYLLPTKVPDAVCPALMNCSTLYCDCLGSTMVSGECAAMDPTPDALNRCAPVYAQCATRAATDTVQLAVDYGVGIVLEYLPLICLQWAVAVSRDYSVRLYRPLSNDGDAAEALEADCKATVCRQMFEPAQINSTLVSATESGRAAACSVFNQSLLGPELPFPYLTAACPVVPAGTPMPLQSVLLTPELRAECPAVSVCLPKTCRCLSESNGWAYNASCSPKEFHDSSVQAWAACTAQSIDCVVNAAYGTMVDPNRTTRCNAWATNLTSAYGTWYYASIRTVAPLHDECSAFACALLSSDRPLATLAPTFYETVCAFKNVSTVPSRVPCTSYTCPDDTCAPSPMGCACTINATLQEVTLSYASASATIGTIGTLEYGVAVAASVAGLYRVPANVPCSNADFTSFLRFDWTLERVDPLNPAVGMGVVFAANATSAIHVPASLLVRWGWYNVSVAVVTFHPASNAVTRTTFRVVDPTPVVSITFGGSERRVSSSGFSIAAVVQDVFLNQSAFQWSCNVSSALVACPANLTTALNVNGTIAGVVVGWRVPAGTWTITFTYKGISSALLLTVTDKAIPVVQLIVGGKPIAPRGHYYISTQSIPIAGAAVYSSSGLTYQWRVNGVSYGVQKSIVVPAATLMLSSDHDIAKAVPNTVVLRVTSTSDASVYGEATALLYVARPPTLAVLNISNRFSPALPNATALLDAMSLQFASNLINGSAAFGATPTFLVSFFKLTNGVLRKVPLFTTTSVIDTAGGTLTRTVLEAPLPNTRQPSASVQFTVDALLNGVVAASANGSFTIVMPSTSAAAASQQTLLSTLTDPIAAAPTVVNIATLMEVSVNATLIQAMAASLLASMTTTITNASEVPGDIQAMYLTSLVTVVAASTSMPQTTTVVVVGIVQQFVVSTTFDASESAQTALDVVGTLAVDVTATVADAIATQVAATTSIGQSVVLTSGLLTVAAMLQPAASFAASTLRTPSAEFAVPLEFVFPGGATISSTSTVAVVAAQVSGNPFASTGVPAPLTSSVVAFRLLVDSSEMSVSGLQRALVFNVKTSNPGQAACWYYDTATSTWSQSGLQVIGTTGDEVTCSTTHLTSFGVFASQSSASALAAAALVPVLLAFASQIALMW